MEPDSEVRMLGDLAAMQDGAHGPHQRYVIYDSETLDRLIAQHRVDPALLPRLVVYRQGVPQFGDGRPFNSDTIDK